MAVIEFGNGHTFKVGGQIVEFKRLFEGQVIKIHGENGEFRVVEKIYGKKFTLKAERMPSCLFKTFHRNIGRTLGVEAVCGQNQLGQPTEYLTEVYGKKQWVRAVDCSGAE